MKKSIKKALVMFLSVAMVFSMMIVPTYADELMDAADAGSYVEEVRSAATVEDVLAAIGELSNDPRDYTAADKEKVEAIQADYEALSADDQAIIDSTKNHPSGDSQSYGRVLEAAVWAVRSFDTDVTTTLANGTYTTATDPAVSSQSDKGKSDSSRVRNWWVESVTVEDGQATAYIYVTDGESTGSKLTSYPSVWIGGQTIARDENNNYAIPVDLNGTTYFGGISSSMPRPIMYALSTTITEPGATEPGEGTVYTGDAIQFTFTDVEGVFDLVSCEKVTVMRGDAVAELKIQFYKDSGHRIGIDDIIDGTNGPSLSYTKDDQEIATVQVPVALGEEHTISAMDDLEGDYWPIRFTVNVTGQEPQAIDLTIVNNTGMFKAVTASAVKNEDGSAVLTMALSGSGYHYLYKGTYEQAVANGAHTENWIEGYLNDAGLWEFKIPMEASELGKTVSVTAVSQSYYEKYLNGQNSIDRAFYPRQLNLDLEAATLVTDDYKTEKEITVTNNVPMFKPGTKATLDCVGGPNSNNYKADLILPMQSTSLSNVFVGSFAEAEAATNTIAFNADDKTFTIPVKWVATFGKPETLVNLANGETFYMSFKSASNGKWYERKATLDENAGTLVFDPSNADYTAVTAAQAAAAAIDRDLYTEESLAALDAALNAVVTGKFESQQAEVDAMAQAINDAIAALVEKPHPEKAVLRIYGKDRVKTSLKIADELLALSESDKFDKVILASGINYPDALAGSHLSCAGNCPILLLDGNSANLAAVQDYIKENLAEGGTIYMLGGAAAVPEEATTGLGEYEIVRLGGKDRYATDLMILEEGLKLDPEADEILVSTAFGFADSLSAASVGKPILLVGAALTDSQKEFLAGLEGDYTFTAVGGTAVVSEAVMEELKAYGETDRVSGKDRYQTSVAVANKYFKKPEFGVLAYALNYPDGLCGGGLAYAMNAPLILTNDGATGPAVAFAEENEMIYGAVLGGTSLISDDSVRAIFHMDPEDEIVVR